MTRWRVCGARLVLYPSPLHYKQIPGQIRIHRATVLFATATFLAHYARNAEAGDFASLRLVVAGAEKLGEPVRELWRSRYGLEILEGYGVTEMAPVIAVNPPAPPHLVPNMPRLWWRMLGAARPSFCSAPIRILTALAWLRPPTPVARPN